MADHSDTYAAYEQWDLTDIKVVLEFESRNLPQGRKQELILRHFKVSAARYYQHLNAILNGTEAVLVDPVTVYRLREIRDRRVDARARSVLLREGR